jgi:hypothetical protein
MAKLPLGFPPYGSNDQPRQVRPGAEGADSRPVRIRDTARGAIFRRAGIPGKPAGGLVVRTVGWESEARRAGAGLTGELPGNPARTLVASSARGNLDVAVWVVSGLP